MAQTFRRQPLSISTSGSDYPKSYFFTQAQFKGLCDNQNDVSIDPLTFSDVQNMYVNDDGILMSRPPLKFSDGENNIVGQWNFGQYGLRLYRTICYADNDIFVEVNDITEHDIQDLYFVFTFRCITHETITETLNTGKAYNEYQWALPVLTMGWDVIPKVTCAQIEDKVFIWFAGIDLIVFNTIGLYFEDGAKYLYCPIHKLIINDIESDLETKNYLTETYRRRYQYSSVSTVNFERLAGKNLSVGLNSEMTQGKSKHLYDITVQEHQEKMMLYPYSAMGNYYIDIAQTARATVVLRYSIASYILEVSFDGKFFRPLPTLEDIIGLPQLTRDGLWVVAFTRKGLAKCKLVAQESTDFINDENVFTWTREPYLYRVTEDGTPCYLEELDITFTPTGYFETIDQFAYIFKGPSIFTDITGNIPYLYTEYLSGSNDVLYGYEPLIDFSSDNTQYGSIIPNDDLKIHFRYAPALIQHKDLGAVISIMTPSLYGYYNNTYTEVDVSGVLTYFFKRTEPNRSSVDRVKYINMSEDVIFDDAPISISMYYGLPCRKMDVQCLAPIIETDKITYEFIVAYSLGTYYNKENRVLDCICTYRYELINDEFTDITGKFIYAQSNYLRIMPNTKNVLTDNYLYYDNDIITRPQNGELDINIFDTGRNLTSNDKLCLILQENNETTVYEANIYKLNDDGTLLASGIIQSGDIISYKRNAETEQDYLTPDGITDDGDTAYASKSNRFYIEKIAANADTHSFDVVPGMIKQNDLIRLRAYDREINLPVDNPGNPSNTTLIIEPWKYPSAPENWELGDDWPALFPTKPPLMVNEDGSIRSWRPGDNLPVGYIEMYGIVTLSKQIKPISIDVNGLWYDIDGTLWTSQLSTENIIELDEYVNTETTKQTREINVNALVPEKHAVMNEHYFSYIDNGKNLLQITQTRRDEDGTDLLLYLPKYNEQLFANPITALHPLSNTEMGIFTDTDVWYVSTSVSNEGAVLYTKPIKSSIPVGLREGSDVITALDGQALLFPTLRGLVALAPQDFIATTEKTLTYLTDAIQNTYYQFYTKPVVNAALAIKNENLNGYKPLIHLNTYKYWILMYKELDRELFLFDTRNGTWWKWTIPYPIKSIFADMHLHLLLQIDFSPYDDYTLGRQSSLLGVSFELLEQGTDTSYCDDTVSGALNGFVEKVYENEQIGNRYILHYASPLINWHFVSQKLHFDQINNYKAIKGINLNIKGEEIMTAKMSTKVFRNLYHPEQSDTVQIKINDIRTFVKHFNLMHVIDFQYKIENDIDAVNQQPFKLNSLSIKYETKERIR